MAPLSSGMGETPCQWIDVYKGEQRMKYESRPCTAEDEELIDEKLTAMDHAMVPPEEGAQEECVIYKITDEEGSIIAGCILMIDSWKMALLDVLWVEEKYRRAGLGSALVHAAEKAARDRDCYVMILGTYEFQARPFYEKHGYELRGIIRDFPRGQANYALMKRLDRPMEGHVPSGDLFGEFEIKPGNREDAAFIGKELGNYNSSQATRVRKYLPLNKKLVDEDGNLIAAIFAGLGTWNQLEIDMMWVEEPYRDQGIGSGLLAETEAEAKGLGAYFALAEGLFDWQAGFFKKNGYEVIGAMEDCPKGHSMLILEKRFEDR